MSAAANPYRDFAGRAAALIRETANLPLGGFAPLPRPAVADDAPVVLIFSPHPDDECIIGGLAFRLLREAGMRVINVAVTQGSNKARQQPRLDELRAACDFVGLELITTIPDGLETVNLKGRADADSWAAKVACIADILRTHQPHTVFLPHVEDWNSTHIGTYHLVVDALTQLGDLDCFTVETEYWGAMDDPNLMVELSDELLGDMTSASGSAANWSAARGGTCQTIPTPRSIGCGAGRTAPSQRSRAPAATSARPTTPAPSSAEPCIRSATFQCRGISWPYTGLARARSPSNPRPAPWSTLIRTSPTTARQTGSCTPSRRWMSAICR
jgi:LmbE family N-acetylglucosaminyl deacetylase